MDDFSNKEGTVTFLPENLNRCPVVMRGLTSDEVIATFVIGIVVGLVAGVITFFIFGKPALIPTVMFVITGFILMFTASLLRRLKRNKPDTWFYRKVQWVIQYKLGFRFGKPLITRSGHWTIRRSEPSRIKLLQKISEQTNE